MFPGHVLMFEVAHLSAALKLHLWAQSLSEITSSKEANEKGFSSSCGTQALLSKDRMSSIIF